MFMKEGDPIEKENTVAAFKRSADRETLTKQQRMQDDIDTYTKMQVKLTIVVKMSPDFAVTRKAPKKSKKGGKRSACKMVIAKLGKRVEKYDLIKNFAQDQAGITFGLIARGDIDFVENEFQKIPCGKMGRALVNFARKDEVQEVSMFRHLLVRVQVCSESKMALFDSGALPNVISIKIVKKLHVRIQPTNSLSKLRTVLRKNV